MKKILIALMTVLLVFFLIWSCKHEPEEFVGPDPPGPGPPGPDPPIENPCDPDTVYFAKDLLPILQSTCSKPGCHDDISMQDGLRLTDYSSVIQTADIRPGDPGGSDHRIGSRQAHAAATQRSNVAGKYRYGIHLDHAGSIKSFLC
ncbi:MAG: hypothetical protein RQ761_02645 [Bacteroidales bacterium]|nr:hypothetical protein [Bacteroidales bacterium]